MKKVVALILIVAVVAAGLLLLRKRKADRAQASPAPILAAVVAIRDLEIQPVTLTLPAMGIVASDVSALLSTRISGQVTAVFKKEGDPVAKGEILARIDAMDLEAKKQGVALQRQGIVFQVESKKVEFDALLTALKSAEEAHARTKELLDIKGASAEQYSQEEAEIARIKASLTAARNSVETLQKSMETLGASMREIDSLMNYAAITAPIDGTVSQILVRPGHTRQAVAADLIKNRALFEPFPARYASRRGSDAGGSGTTADFQGSDRRYRIVAVCGAAAAGSWAG